MSKGNGHQTKADETGHAGHSSLSVPQLAAVELLAVGKTDTEAAEALGVTRQTVNGWKNHDPAFRAEVNRRRRELWEEAHDRLRGLATKALDVLAGALEGDRETALPAAVHVLKALKVYGEVGAPNGPATVEGVLLAEAEREASRELSERTATLDPVARLLAEQQDRPALVQAVLLRLQAKYEIAQRAARK